MRQEFNRQRLLAAYQVVQQSAVDSIPSSEIAHRLQVFDTVLSTNQTAWELMAAANEDAPIVVALTQTAGRGQWGRHWQSEAGGLYLSVGVRLRVPVAHAAQLTLCTAWGLATALRQIPARLSGVPEGIPVQLKWLNDLVLEGRKLGGILTETRIQRQHITRAVIGVGLNWTNPVPETGMNLQMFLADHSIPLIESLEMLTAIALHGIFQGIQYQQAGRLDDILAGYLELLAHRDRPIRWQDQDWAIVGVAPTGELRVQPKWLETAANQSAQSISTHEILIQPGTINLGYPL